MNEENSVFIVLYMLVHRLNVGSAVLCYCYNFESENSNSVCPVLLDNG